MTTYRRGIDFKMLCAKGSISTSSRLSCWALLTGLAFAVGAVGPAIAEAQADAPDATNLDPGRYAAVCIPAPMFGCVCTTDPLGEALTFTGLDSTPDNHRKEVGDSEYLRMISGCVGPAHRSPNRQPLAEPDALAPAD